MQSESDWTQWVDSEAVSEAMAEMSKTPSDRGAVVLAGAMLEDQLVHLLESAVINDLKGKRMREVIRDIGYSRVCDWAYRLGLIDRPILDELKTLGNIRNRFAHEWTASLNLESKVIAGLVKNLTAPNQLLGDESGASPYVQEHVISSVKGWLAASVASVLAELRTRADEATPPVSPRAASWHKSIAI